MSGKRSAIRLLRGELKPTGKRYRCSSVHTETEAVICGYEWCKKICLLLLVSKRGQCSVGCIDVSGYESRTFTIGAATLMSQDNNIDVRYSCVAHVQ